MAASAKGGWRPWQRYLAECIGTFALVFAGCGAVLTNTMTGGAVTHLGVSLTFGMIVAVMIFALGPVCAAHFNPAVTLGLASAGRFPWRHAPAYVLAQGVGAVLASLAHRAFYGAEIASRAGYGATLPSVPAGAAIGFEIILAFILMLVIMAVATDGRVPSTTPALAIGLTVALCAAFGGPVTGASMNPARSLGPALFAGGRPLDVVWIYLLAPPLGAVLGARCYELLRDGPHHARSAPCDLEG